MKLATSLRTALIPALAALALSGLGYAPAAYGAQADTWHVHDGVDAPVPVGFAALLTGDHVTPLTDAERAVYLQDPLRCPNATDKALLGDGRQAQQPLRSGVCFTDVYLIHLRTIAADAPVPDSWSVLNTETSGGISWKTVYRLTVAQG